MNFTLSQIHFQPRLTKKGTGLVGSCRAGTAFIAKRHIYLIFDADIQWVCVERTPSNENGQPGLLILEPVQKPLYVHDLFPFCREEHGQIATNPHQLP